jgi:hypothetical protein
VYCKGKLPEVFTHVKYVFRTWDREESMLIASAIRHIMLVSPNAATPGEDNGWDFADLLFWEPLLRQHRTLLRKKSLGQMIHHFFPNLKYAVALGAPVRQTATPTASVYVSDRNLIEPRDTKAFRKMVFDTIWEFRHGRNAPRDFTDVKATPEFRAERLNVPEFRDLLHLVKENDFLNTMAPERAVAENFAAFRDTALYFVDGVTFLLHLTTETEPDAMTKSVNAKILHLFSMARRLMTEDKVTYTQPRFALQMDIDFGFNNIPQGEDFFMRMAFWMVEVCAFSVIRSLTNTCVWTALTTQADPSRRQRAGRAVRPLRADAARVHHGRLSKMRALLPPTSQRKSQERTERRQPEHAGGTRHACVPRRLESPRFDLYEDGFLDAAFVKGRLLRGVPCAARDVRGLDVL